jgi:uncharacterized membrane protein
MPSVNYTLDIQAPPEKIFDLISRVEEFKNFSKLIRDVRTLSPKRFFWRAEYLGISFEWESDITVFERPERFAWESTSGIYTSGSYTLRPSNGGTCVEFKMEFNLPRRLTDIFSAPALTRIMTTVHREVLESIKKELKLSEDIRDVDRCNDSPRASH